MNERPYILLTGASGFLGSTLREKLSPQYRLLSVDRLPLPSATKVGETFVQLDLANPSEQKAFWNTPLAWEDVAGAIFLAAYYDFANLPHSRYDGIEKGLTLFLSEFADRCPSSAPFLFSSSMAAIEPTTPGVRQSAHWPRQGLWEYPRSKLRCEQILENAKISQPRGELVTAAVYSDYCELVPLYRTIEMFASRPLERIFFPAEPSRGLTYVHREDAAAAYLSALPALSGKTGVFRVLIGEEQPTSYQTIRDSVSASLGKGHRNLVRVPRSAARAVLRLRNALDRARGRTVFFVPWMLANADEHFEFDLSATRELLNWTPKKSLERELGPMLQRRQTERDEWFRRNEARSWARVPE